MVGDGKEARRKRERIPGRGGAAARDGGFAPRLHTRTQRSGTLLVLESGDHDVRQSSITSSATYIACHSSTSTSTAPLSTSRRIQAPAVCRGGRELVGLPSQAPLAHPTGSGSPPHGLDIPTGKRFVGQPLVQGLRLGRQPSHKLVGDQLQFQFAGGARRDRIVQASSKQPDVQRRSV